MGILGRVPAGIVVTLQHELALSEPNNRRNKPGLINYPESTEINGKIKEHFSFEKEREQFLQPAGIMLRSIQEGFHNLLT